MFIIEKSFLKNIKDLNSQGWHGPQEITLSTPHLQGEQLLLDVETHGPLPFSRGFQSRFDQNLLPLSLHCQHVFIIAQLRIETDLDSNVGSFPHWLWECKGATLPLRGVLSAFIK